MNFGKSRLSRDSILESEARENNHQKTGGNQEEGRFGTRNQRFNPLHSKQILEMDVLFCEIFDVGDLHI